MTETDRKEHQTVKELLYELQNHSLTDPEAPAATALFDALMKDLTEHIDYIPQISNRCLMCIQLQVHVRLAHQTID